jgi:hypothetical protein
MLGDRQTGLRITEASVNPLQLRHILWPASRDNRRQLTAAIFCDSTKAGQAIGEHRSPRNQMIFCRSGPPALSVNPGTGVSLTRSG